MSVLKELGTPVFYAEGMPSGLTRENYRLQVDGLIEGAPLEFSYADLRAMTFTSVSARLTSVSGWSVRADWQGVRFIDFLEGLDILPQATHVRLASASIYTTCVPLEKLRYEKVLICYRVAGEDLEIEYGGPVRMFIPHLWGYKSVKGLSRLTFTDSSVPGYWEVRGYPDDAEITPGTVFDVNSGTSRRIRGGEITEF